MKPVMKFIMLAVLSAVLLVGAIAAYRYLTSVTAAPSSPPGAETKAPDKKNAAPDFTVTDGDGNEVKLADRLGKPVIINFWATWCPPCRSELPAFETLYGKYGNDVVFMMIDLSDGYRETPEIVKKFISENGYTFPVYYDVKENAARAYNVSSIPLTVAVDRNGKIYKTHLGAMSEKTLEKLIKSLSEVK